MQEQDYEKNDSYQVFEIQFCLMTGSITAA